MRTPDRVSSIRRKAGTLALLIGSGLAALAVAPVHAMDAAAVAEHQRDKQEKDAPPPRREPRREERPAQAGPPAVVQQRQDPRPPTGQFQAPPQQQPQYQGRGGFRDRGEVRNGNRDGVVFGPPRGTQGPDARIVPPSRAYGYNRPPPPERVVPRLPPGYRQYNWGGSPYYNHGGRWYRPYGGS